MERTGNADGNPRVAQVISAIRIVLRGGFVSWPKDALSRASFCASASKLLVSSVRVAIGAGADGGVRISGRGTGPVGPVGKFIVVR
jgi:hypothetical protein